MKKRYFTLQEANALVPWLDSVLREASSVREELAAEEQALDEVLRKTRSNGQRSLEKEIVQGRQRVESLTQQLRALVAQITNKGIIVRDLDRGLVDFPSLREGREVYLCWLWGEEEIAFWHEVDAGFAGRQPL